MERGRREGDQKQAARVLMRRSVLSSGLSLQLGQLKLWFLWHAKGGGDAGEGEGVLMSCCCWS